MLSHFTLTATYSTTSMYQLKDMNISCIKTFKNNMLWLVFDKIHSNIYQSPYFRLSVSGINSILKQQAYYYSRYLMNILLGTLAGACLVEMDQISTWSKLKSFFNLHTHIPVVVPFKISCLLLVNVLRICSSFFKISTFDKSSVSFQK